MNKEAVIGSLNHPLRREILKHVVEKDEPLSPDRLAKEFGQPFGNVSYHVRHLKAAGALVLVDRQPVRGSLQHYYRHSTTVTSSAWVRALLGLPPVDGERR